MNRAILIGALLIEIVGALSLFPRIDRDRIKTSDFLNFYAAGLLVQEGNGPVLYRRETQGPVLEQLLGNKSPQYFLHPPFEAAMLEPLSYLSVEHAFVVWTLFSLGLIGLLPLVLKDCIPLVAQRPYLPLLGFAFYPIVIAVALGQDSVLLLFVLSVAYMLMARGNDFWSGMVLSLAAIKFQYLLILLLLLLCGRKLRVVAGSVLGCVCLGLISVLVVGTHGIVEYVAFVHSFNAHMGYGALNLTLMVNLRGLLAGQGLAGSWNVVWWAGGAALLLAGAWCARMFPAGVNNLVFALFVALSLAASPYSFFPDMTILLLPILLALDYAARTAHARMRAAIFVLCGLFFVLPLALVALGGHRWWNSRIFLMDIAILLFIGALAWEVASATRSLSESGLRQVLSPPRP